MTDADSQDQNGTDQTTANAQAAENAQPRETDAESGSGVSGHDHCHDTVDADTRETVLERDSHRCQTCGRAGPQEGGLATLHVHHIERDPDGLDEHDIANLTTLCRSCHSWHHQKTTEADVPVDISDADLSVLLPQDIEILRILAAEGPASTGDIAAALTADLTVMAVRERLWVLMGLDNIVESREQQLIDQDVDTGDWGLTGQIATSARGHIPNNPRLLFQRIEDELVRQALARGCSRDAVTDVLDMAQRTTFYKEKRAHAFDFPLDAIDSRGRPPESAHDDPSSAVGEPTECDSADQQRLDAVAEGGPDGDGATAAGNTPATTADELLDDSAADDGDGSVDSDAPSSEAVEDTEEIRDNLQQAIEALQAVNASL